jgi:hypothetical protein
MKFNKSILAAAALSVGLFSCADEFQDMNQDPSAITKANISYLFAQSVNNSNQVVICCGTTMHQ